jgi:sugar phosphate isomerase/epimerase
MRFCLNQAFLGVTQVTPERAKWVYDIGFRVVGVNVMRDETATDAQIEQARKVIADAGLYPAVGVSGVSLLRPDPAEVDREMKKFVRLIQICGKLGCNVLQASGGSLNPKGIWSHHKDNFAARTMDQIVANAKKLAPVAEDNNVTICPETTQWTVLHNIESMRDYIDRVGSPCISVTFDFVNHMTPERIYDQGAYIRRVIQTLGDRICAFHVKDVQVDEKALLVAHINECLPGTGVFDHEILMRESTKLEGWKPFSLEHIRSDDGVKQAFDYLQGVAKRIGHKWTDSSAARRKGAA